MKRLKERKDVMKTKINYLVRGLRTREIRKCVKTLLISPG